MKVYMGPYKQKGHRKIEVRIDDYDTWSLYTTLSRIILPALERFQEDITGIPATDVDDGPGTEDLFCEKRWEYILNEMIYAHKSIVKDREYRWDEKENARVTNGLRLFSKYYFNLWN